MLSLGIRCITTKLPRYIFYCIFSLSCICGNFTFLILNFVYFSSFSLFLLFNHLLKVYLKVFGSVDAFLLFILYFILSS